MHGDLENFLARYFAGVQKAGGEVRDEVSYLIPKDQAANFGAFFKVLD